MKRLSSVSTQPNNIQAIEQYEHFSQAFQEVKSKYNNETTNDCVQGADNAVLKADIEISEIREDIKQIKYNLQDRITFSIKC